MHITSGLSPASGEMLDASLLNIYGDSGENCGYFAVDNAVPESSHTVEIEYVYEQPHVYAQDDVIVNQTPLETVNAPQSSEPTKTAREKPKPEKIIDNEPEADLTNLTWLQNITNIMAVPQFPISPMSPNPPAKVPPPNTRLQKFNQTIAKCQKDFMENRAEYRTNSAKKPPCSYSTLICMAMRYNNDKMTLSAIYNWIRDNFKYYRNADPTWQNSIRHNLSLNKVFVKVARSKHEPGKGGFWKLDLAHLEGARCISNRPQKKKKKNSPNERSEEQKQKEAEEKTAVANLPQVDTAHIGESVTLHLPDLNLQSLSGMDIETNIGANVIVEPTIPPLIAEDDLSSLLLTPTDWDDLQLDMLDNYLDSCFK